jgi:hypothetical protein
VSGGFGLDLQAGGPDEVKLVRSGRRLAMPDVSGYFFPMSFEALTREIAAWPDDQIRRFQAFLVALRHQREQGTLEKLAAKLDDPESVRWISLEDAAKRLGLADA